MKLATSSVVLALATATTASATTIFFRNQCPYPIPLWDNHNEVTIPPGGRFDRFLPMGWMGMFRSGRDPQATLGEFTMADGKAWFDISIIPTAPGRGPDLCPSLAECKRHTGGVGYNEQMQIAPLAGINGAHCRVLTCMFDGCPDAYQFPKDDTKTHNCPYGTNFELTFCPGGPGGATPPPTPPPTPEPTAALLPVNGTASDEERSIKDTDEASSKAASQGSGSYEFEAGEEESAVLNASDLADKDAELATPEPSTDAPVVEAPVVEANTQTSGGGPSAVGYVMIALLAVAATVGVGVVVIARRKRKELEALEDKHSIISTTPANAL